MVGLGITEIALGFDFAKETPVLVDRKIEHFFATSVGEESPTLWSVILRRSGFNGSTLVGSTEIEVLIIFVSSMVLGKKS